MDLLLTWSGSASHDLASLFRTWLPTVLPGIKPWISDEDIAKGKQWFPELMNQLDKSRISITFITPDNIRSPWVYYEVGVIAAKLAEGFVCPYLVGVDGKHVKDSPLGQFQWTQATKDDTWKLIRSINGLLPLAHSEQLLEGNFNTHWPKLKRQIDKLVDSMRPVVEAVTETEPPVEELLSPEARQLIMEGAQDQNGRIMYLRMMGSTVMQTNGKNLITDRDPRTEATWRGALEELVDAGLASPLGHKGEQFEMTRNGYEVADRIKSRLPGEPS